MVCRRSSAQILLSSASSSVVSYRWYRPLSVASSTGTTAPWKLGDAIAQGTVVEHDGRISGYATDLGFIAHAVGESNDDLEALIMAADALAGPAYWSPPRTRTRSDGVSGGIASSRLTIKRFLGRRRRLMSV